MFIPEYSSYELNPIELYFNDIKLKYYSSKLTTSEEAQARLNELLDPKENRSEDFARFCDRSAALLASGHQSLPSEPPTPEPQAPEPAAGQKEPSLKQAQLETNQESGRQTKPSLKPTTRRRA